MVGHVNMMDDVLIFNLPQELLRSSLRELVSHGAVNQKPFVQHIRQHFADSPLAPPPGPLFPSEETITSSCRKYLEATRCLFASKLVRESLPHLINLVNAMKRDDAKWTAHSPAEDFLAELSGDIVQAMQALKESSPEPNNQLEEHLLALAQSLQDCRAYCHQAGLTFPFTRAERQVRDTYSLILSKPCPVSSVDASSGNLQTQLETISQAHVEKVQLGSFNVPRLFNGFWQLSSPAWGSATSDKQAKALTELIGSGLVAADMADHYGDAELVYGEFRAKLHKDIAVKVFAATKWCVFRSTGRPLSREWVHQAVMERSRRLGGRVELLQFHWYDYESKDYLQILEELVNISKSTPELVSSIGLCNFDSQHVEEACEYLIEKTGSASLVSNQVQYSLLDSRPLHKMGHVCDKYGMKLLTYGSLCGGFLSQKWLGQPVPEVYSPSNPLTPSQRKYLDMIRHWGTWAEFQELLTVLLATSQKHGVTLTNVATRWVLQQASVGAVIVGTRLGVVTHGKDNLVVFRFSLTEEDMANINHLALGPGRERSLALFERLGDCGNEYRAMH